MEGKAPNGGGVERDLAAEAARLAELARELQDAASSLISRTRNEEQALQNRAEALDSDLRRLPPAVATAVRGGSIDPKIAEKAGEELYRARLLFTDGDLASLLPGKDHG